VRALGVRSLFLLFFFIILPFPILGYLSAKQYNVCYANAYAAFMRKSFDAIFVANLLNETLLISFRFLSVVHCQLCR
jgi:hypothetical protein